MLSDIIDQQIENIALGEPWKPIFYQDMKLIQDFQKFIGSYEISSNDTFEITAENDELYYQENGQSKHYAFPYSANSIFIKGINARIRFTEDEKNGKVTFTAYYGTAVSAYMVTGIKR